MQYGPLVEIPPGYCFIPSCGQEPNPTSKRTTTSTVTPSPSQSRTTSTTTIFGPTITASTPTHHKRSASPTHAPANEEKPMEGTHAFAGFPTDAAIPVGAGPICIVQCQWVREQNANGEATASERMSASTMMSVSRSTMDISIPTTSAPSPTTRTTIIGSITLELPKPTLPPSSSNQHPHPSAGQVTGIVFGSLASLALLLAGAWLIMRKIRQVRARLNKHNQGVHRDWERGVWEAQGGDGVPELGGRKAEGAKGGEEGGKEDVEMDAMGTGKGKG
ncbi:MAG: hypothetical protein Q9202_003439 [Teloschistes flavicans]